MDDIHSSLKPLLVIDHGLCHGWDRHDTVTCFSWLEGRVQLELRGHTNTAVVRKVRHILIKGTNMYATLNIYCDCKILLFHI